MVVPSSLPPPAVILPEGGADQFPPLSPEQQLNIAETLTQYTQRRLQEHNENWAELRTEVGFCSALLDRISESQAQLAQGIARYGESVQQRSAEVRQLEERVGDTQVRLQALQQNTAELQRRVNNLTALSNEAMEAVRRSRLLDNAPPRASSFLGDILDAITDGFSAVGGFLSSLLEKVKSLFSCGG